MTNDDFRMQQGSIEEGLLAATKTMEQWLEVSQFDVDDFTVRKDLFLFIRQYLQQYGTLPSSSQISTRFTWSPPIGDFAYWLDEMKRYTLARRILETMEKTRSIVGRPKEALSYALEALGNIRARETHHIQAYDQGAEERLAAFDLRRENYLRKEISGIPTGMKVIDDTLVGWTPSSLIGCYARTSVGKTWWLCWQGAIAWMQGYRVLLISTEIATGEINVRIDNIIANMMNLGINYQGLRQGNPAVRDNYVKLIDTLKEHNRWWTYDSLNENKIGLGDITALIRQHLPDIVLVDGITLLNSSVRGESWEKMKDLAYGLKSIATINSVPVIVTHQSINLQKGHKFNEENVSGRGDTFIMPSLNDSAYGDSFVQACSDVITMVPDTLSPNVTWYAIKKHRDRGWDKPLPSRMAFITDFGRGLIHDLSILGHNPQAVGEETRRLLDL